MLDMGRVLFQLFFTVALPVALHNIQINKKGIFSMPSFTSQWDTQPSTGFMLLKIALVSTSTESAASRARVTYSIAWEKSRIDE